MATTMKSIQNTPFYIADVQIDRVMIRSIDSDMHEPDVTFGAIPFPEETGLWYIPCAKTDFPFPSLLMKLRDKGLSFLNAGPGWHPGGIFADLREKGKVTGNYSTLVFLGNGTFKIEDNK